MCFLVYSLFNFLIKQLVRLSTIAKFSPCNCSLNIFSFKSEVEKNVGRLNTNNNKNFTNGAPKKGPTKTTNRISLVERNRMKIVQQQQQQQRNNSKPKGTVAETNRNGKVRKRKPLKKQEVYYIMLLSRHIAKMTSFSS